MWSTRQFSTVIDQFWADECTDDLRRDLLKQYALLRGFGPMCGPLVAKKLKNGKGIWELLARAGNLQPRWLFYFKQREIIFVHAFMKQGPNAYVKAIPLAQKRRALIESGGKSTNDIALSQPTVH